jgi:CheY-like chemotaxis protein
VLLRIETDTVVDWSALIKVLLVEDNKSTLMIMSRLLRQKLGLSVVVASSVTDALRVAEEEEGEVDVVVSDIGLPDGSGLDLMRELKAKHHLRVRSLPSLPRPLVH